MKIDKSAIAVTENLTDEQIINNELAQGMFRATIGMAKSKMDDICNQEDKKMLLNAIKEFELTSDFYEQTIHIITISTLIFSSLFDYTKLMEKVLSKYLPHKR